MPAITAENAAGWQKIAEDLAPQRPSVGKWVRVLEGRKHVGKIGQVVRHERDRYDRVERYRSEASMHFIDMRGREGFVVLVQDARNPSRFWVKASYVVVVDRPSVDDADE